MKTTSIFIAAMLLIIGAACKKTKPIIEEIPVKVEPVVVEPNANQSTLALPPSTWQEHWFDHNQLVKRKFYDNSLVVYHDNDVSSSVTWPNTFLAQVWNYTKQKYGSFGTDPRLYAIFHTGRYSGGHPSTYMDAGHDYRNVIDCGSSSTSAWLAGTGNDLDLTTHEVGHIVEGASKNTKGSPAFGIWHDSKWMEIYNYDVYIGLGRTADAQRWYNLVVNGSDSYPRVQTHWFKDWFYPIYAQQGNAASLNTFFTLLSQHLPRNIVWNGKANIYEYARALNFGEFVITIQNSS